MEILCGTLYHQTYTKEKEREIVGHMEPITGRAWYQFHGSGETTEFDSRKLKADYRPEVDTRDARLLTDEPVRPPMVHLREQRLGVFGVCPQAIVTGDCWVSEQSVDGCGGTCLLQLLRH